MATKGYVEPSDRDAVAWLMGEAAANRNTRPEIACALARAAKGIADTDHRGRANSLPDFEEAIPTHGERIWGKPVDQRIIDRLCSWIEKEASK